MIAIFGSTGFWSFLQSRHSKTSEILTELKSIKKEQAELRADVKQLRSEVGSNEAKNCRNRIVRFADEIRLELKHSKDMYDQIMIDIDDYELYCSQHEGFKNSVATVSIKKIKQKYEQDDFL